jgi:hypothetical protein
VCFSSSSFSFGLNADRAAQLKPSVRRFLGVTAMSFNAQIIIILVAFSSMCPAAVGQKQQTADQARDAVCQRVPCRPPTTVRLKLNAKEYFEMEFPKGPYVADGFVNVLVGEELFVEFDDAEGPPSNPHYVKDSTKPERTISFRLEQMDDGTVLRVKNPFTKTVLYDCFIQHYSQQQLRKTSILPVPAGLMGFEMWPYPVAQVVISNVRYAQK